MNWPWQRKPEPSHVFVVCEKGQPAVVCADDATVRQELTDRDKRVTQVHQVPFRKGDA